MHPRTSQGIIHTWSTDSRAHWTGPVTDQHTASRASPLHTVGIALNAKTHNVGSPSHSCLITCVDVSLTSYIGICVGCLHCMAASTSMCCPLSPSISRPRSGQSLLGDTSPPASEDELRHSQRTRQGGPAWGGGGGMRCSGNGSGIFFAGTAASGLISVARS